MKIKTLCRKYTGIIYKHTQINEHILNTIFNNVILILNFYTD